MWSIALQERVALSNSAWRRVVTHSEGRPRHGRRFASRKPHVRLALTDMPDGFESRMFDTRIAARFLLAIAVFMPSNWVAREWPR